MSDGSATRTIADVTTETELRRQLVHAQRLSAVGKMICGVAHELKNPLTSILGYAQLLRRCGGLPDEANTYIGRIVAEAQRCEHVVSDLLKFTRQRESGKVTTDLNSVVRESIELLRYQLTTNGVAVHEEYAPTALPTVADPYQLRQVVHNLVQNAFDAMREAGDGGHLTVRTRQGDNRVIVELEDDGPGLEDLDSAFKPFYTTKDAGEGTGLGLAVSRSIVEAHGGTISAENTGHGALFRVEFPSAMPAPDASLPTEVPNMQTRPLIAKIKECP